VARIFADVDRLGDFPHIGHVGAVHGTVEWIVEGLPYIIVHEIDERNGQIIVLGIFHVAQQR
jgi:plasmid stabilization system protein ParE